MVSQIREYYAVICMRKGDGAPFGPHWRRLTEEEEGQLLWDVGKATLDALWKHFETGEVVPPAERELWGLFTRPEDLPTITCEGNVDLSEPGDGIDVK